MSTLRRSPAEVQTDTRPATQPADAQADRRAAPPVKGPTDLPQRSWTGVLKRTVAEYKADNLGDLAAALTYYGIQAIFPALIALVSILGLIGHSATQPLLNHLDALAPGPARQIFTGAINGLQRSRGAAGLVFIVAVAGALWSASGYVGAFMRASNLVYEIEEGRPIYKTIPIRLTVTVVLMALLVIGAFAVVVTGGLAKQVGNLFGIGAGAVAVWDIAKWPVLAILVSLMCSILYWASPNVKQPGFRWLSPGGMCAVVVWIVASGAFALYVANFGSYNKTYGTLAGVIIFLVWLWISNVALLLGAEFNAELARGRAIEVGHPPEAEPYMEPRDPA
jgi:membrane protein